MSKHLIKKIHKDGKTITFKYDPAGNMIEKSRTWSDGSQGQKLTYTYNYQDQIAQANDSGYNVMTAGYDHENQRVYTDMPGINPWNGQKFYYWNQSGAIIGEGKVGVNDYVARYFYSGNQKIAMERYDQTSGTSSFYYFINNAQGTPVLIVDEQNNAISKINLDEWGNVGDKTTGPQQEINYTGKKLDIPTRLYYFNQRYYDPEIGRFVNEDPAGQGMNHYAYCANNPIIYTDPNGEFWWFVGMVVGAIAANWGKDLSRPNMLGETLMGAAIGAAVGYGLDTALSNGLLSNVTMEARAGVSIGEGGQYASIGLSQTQQAVSLGGTILGAGYSLYSVATPLFKEQHSEGLGKYELDEKSAVVVERPLFDGSNIIDPMATHTQIIEPEGWSNPLERTWSFGGVNSDDKDGMMFKEDPSKYVGQKILYRFTDKQAYLEAKKVVIPRYQNQPYDFQNKKCHNPIRDMIDATR